MRFGALHITQSRRLVPATAREPDLASKDGAPSLKELFRLDGFAREVFVVDARVDGIVLPTLDGVREDVVRFGDALEERVVVRVGRLGRLLVGVVLQHFFPVSGLDLAGGRLPAEVREAEDGVVVLLLPFFRVRVEQGVGFRFGGHVFVRVDF